MFQEVQGPLELLQNTAHYFMQLNCQRDRAPAAHPQPLALICQEGGGRIRLYDSINSMNTMDKMLTCWEDRG